MDEITRAKGLTIGSTFFYNGIEFKVEKFVSETEVVGRNYDVTIKEPEVVVAPIKFILVL
jgi:hypothetical protein